MATFVYGALGVLMYAAAFIGFIASLEMGSSDGMLAVAVFALLGTGSFWCAQVTYEYNQPQYRNR